MMMVKFRWAKAQLMIEKGEMMQASKFDDKAAMLDEAKKMAEEGMKMTETGMQMQSDQGQSKSAGNGHENAALWRLTEEKGRTEGTINRQRYTATQRRRRTSGKRREAYA